MTRPDSGAARSTRAGVVASAAVLPAVCGHTLAAGAAPDAVTVTGLTLVVALVAGLLDGRERRLGWFVVFVAATAGLVHATLSLTGHHTGATSSTGAGALLMLGWHAVAVAVTAVLLREREAQVFARGRLIAQRIGRALVGSGLELTPVHAVPCAPVATARVPRHLVVTACELARRGPPAG